jgi:NADPH:quinone reductase-like Zn-dependent oxidoreductase
MSTNTSTNRVVRFSQLGGPDVVQLTHEPVRMPEAGEIRLRVHALGLNRAEVMFRTGNYTETPQFPARISSEAAGVVEAVGAGVTEFKAGDRVSTFPGFSMNHYGAAGDTAVVPAKHVAKIPVSLSFEEGATIWTQYLTAHACVIQVGALRERDFVAITAASSSVGVAAIQTVNDAGGVSIAITRKGTNPRHSSLLAHTTSSSAKLKILPCAWLKSPVAVARGLHSTRSLGRSSKVSARWSRLKESSSNTARCSRGRPCSRLCPRW